MDADAIVLVDVFAKTTRRTRSHGASGRSVPTIAREVETIDPDKRVRLEAAGFRETTIAEFLDLSEVEVELIEMHVQLGSAIREERQRRNLSQRKFAQLIGTSQSRLAKMEGGDPSCALDRLIRALLAAGFDRRRVAKIIAA